MRYRVEAIPKKKSLERSFATRLGAEAYCAALYYNSKIGRASCRERVYISV